MKRLVFIICLLFVLALAACTPQSAQTPAPPSPATTAAPAGPSGTAGPAPADGNRSTAGGGAVISATPQATRDESLRFRVSEATPEAERPAPAAPVATVRPLPSADAQRVLDRLPPLQQHAGDTQTFARPAESLPAPRPGTTVEQPFPPVEAQPTPATAAGPLEVTRKSPDGNVELAPYVSVTFNQPMSPLATVDQLAQRDVPLRIEPSVPGQWRWLGTSTLLFVPAGDGKESRLPMATQYTATVPAGTRSMGGSSLASDLVWHFRTPPLTLGSSYPSGDQVRPDTLLVATFDQRIDPAALLRSIRVTAGATQAGTRLATEEEIAADKNVRRLLDANPGRAIAFRTEQPLPSDAQVTVTLDAGAPSAEGPLLTEKAQAFSFRTYGALRVLEHRCSWDPQTCPPMSPWYIRFSNNLDEAAIREGWVSVSPELPGMDVQVRGNSIVIQGRSKGRTSYEVTLASGIRDVFGQTLGSEQKLRFDVGAADAVLYGSDRSFAVLDPAGQPTFSVYSINVPRLKVQLSRVSPADWRAYGQWIENLFGRGTPGPLPGAPAWSGTIETRGNADELTETAIDLAPALKNQRGHVVLFVEAEGVAPSPNRAPVPMRLGVWVQDSNIALDAFVDQSDMIVWTNSVVDGKPMPGVELELMSAGNAVASGTSGADGLATLPLSGAAQLLVARQGDDVSILPESTYVWGLRQGGWQKRPVNDEVRWYVFDDRKLYRPGEEVRVKGWFRRHEGQEGGDLSLFSGASRISYKLSDARGNKLAEGEATANALGGFELKLQIPKEANLGYAPLEITLNGFDTLGSGRYYHQLQIEEFRRPEFEVKTSISEGPHLIGAHAVVTATANYYAGGALPAADVTWNLTSRSGHYSPPNWSDFSFGRWIPWWFDGKPGVTREETETFAGRTDASGKHFLRIDFDSIDPPLPSTMDVQATVMDVNRQAWTSKTSLLVHPSELYVGLRSDRIFVQREDPLPVDVIVVDIDGNPVAGRQVRLTAVRTQWVYRSGEWREADASQQTCIVESGREPVKCTFETPEGGTYRITAIVEDAAGRRNLTEVTRWVSGGDRPSARNVEQEEVMLVPDKKEYRPGDVAHILVQAPFSPAEGVVTLSRSGILSAERFTMSEPSYTLDVPIEESHIPNLQVQVDLVGATARINAAGEPDPAQPKRPAFAAGTLMLRVPPLARELKVAAEPRQKALEPGGTTTVDVSVLDAAGKPVPDAELAVVVVDEAVLAMTGYKLPDPLSVFYSDRDPRSNAYHSRASIILAEPQITLQQREAMEKSAVMERAAMPMAAAPAPAATAAAGARQMAADSAFNAGEAPIAVRTDFSALALFAPSIVTDASGKAQVEVKLPDSLTRYRVMAVAVSGGKQAGLGESAITARLPLMVRPSAPRFLNFGDKFELPVVVQNQTDMPMTVAVVARAGNARFTGASSVWVDVPANDRREVRFPATTVSAGTARFQIGASGAPTGAADRSWVDAASVELPVWTPATAEAFATYGVIDSGSIAQPLIAPTGVYTQFGGLEITTSSTALQALTDAVLYLRDYPFDCAEQIASRMLGIAALRDVLSAFQAEGLPPADELRASVDADIARLHTLQNYDGGFPLWRRGDPDWPYVSVHVAHALQRARSKDFAVPQEMMDLSRAYLREIDRHIPSDYGPLARNTIVAYSLYVRKLMGEPDLARARKMVDDALSATPSDSAKLSAEGLGWLQFVLAGDPGSEIQLQNLRRHFDNQVVETAGAAHFGTPYGEQGYLLLASDRRADAVILEAMMADRPQSDLIPKLVAGLLAHRKAGRWSNTQENVFVLLALDKYFNTYEAQTPDFVARMWLGAQYAGESEFRGRTTERSLVKVPMSMLVGGTGQQNVIVAKDGDGRLYYRLGLRYAPSDLDLKPADYGFTVERRYEAVDNAADVTQDADGVWHVKAGARVRTQITLVAPTRRYHVALVDPLPAGFEAQNPELAVTGSAPTEPPKGAVAPSMGAVAPGGRPGPAAAPRIASSVAQLLAPKGWWFWRTWYEHQNLRDDRAEAFRSLLWDGVYSYSYVSRATTPGEFVVPPARAEEMYAPETFGRTGTDRVVVE